MELYTQQLLGFMQSPIWIFDMKNEKQVFCNEQGKKLCQDIAALECLERGKEEEIKQLGTIITKLADKGRGEIDCYFSVNNLPMKGKFIVTYNLPNSPHLVLVEGNNLKQSKREELLKGIWRKLREELPSSSACVTLYELKTGKVVFRNEWSRRLFQGEDSSGRLNSDTFLPHVVDRDAVKATLQEILDGTKVRLSQRVRYSDGRTAQHFLLLQKVENPTQNGNNQDLILCHEEDISDFLPNPTTKKIQSEFVALLGMSEILVQTFLSKQQPEGNLVRNSSDTLLKIINMFDLCKLQVGSAKCETIEFDIYDIIEDTVEFSSTLAKSQRLYIASDLPVDLPNKLLGDPVRVKQILLNFVCNALKFSKEDGKVVVKVKVESNMAKDVVIQLEVIDNGIGVSGEKVTNIFPDFDIVCSAYGSNKETGIGLAVSKQLVELMGGNIGFHSKLGEGSTFWCRIPFGKISKVGVPPCFYKIAPANIENAKVLIVGDAKRYKLEILQRYLKDWGLESTIEDDRNVAQDMLSQFELVFISANVPEPYELHKAALSKKVQAVVLSSKRTTGDRLTTLSVPIRRSKLFEFLEKFGTRRRIIQRNMEEQDGEKEQEREGNNKDINVLVVEDNAIAQVFASRILKKSGMCKVDTVVNGKQGVEAFKRGSYDLILMDCQMPELDGYSATKQIRELEKETGGHVIIIAVTAMTMQEDRDRCFQMGMDDYIGKPVTSAVMEEKINHWSRAIKITKEEEQFGAFNRLAPVRNVTRPKLMRNRLLEQVTLPKREWNAKGFTL